MTIRERAQRLMDDTGLLSLLQRFGTPAVVGSFGMDLMTWNDLDIYVDIAGWNADTWCAMAGEVTKALRPVRIDGFCDAAAQQYFFGAEMMHGGERWNIDIWGRTAAGIADAQRRCRDMKARFEAQPGAREAMMHIKAELIERKMYGFDKGARHYHSPEIYAAVLDEGVRSAAELLEIHPV